MEIIMNKNMWLRMMVIVFMSISATMMLSSCGGGGGDGEETDAEIREAIEEDDEDSSAEIVAAEEEVEAEEASADITGVWNGTRSIAYGTTNIQIDFDEYAGTAFTGVYQDTVGYEGDINGQITSDGSSIMFTLTLTTLSPGDVWPFDGSLSEDGTTISGIMEAAGNDNDITLTR
jgi:hypothetical protein